MCLDKKFFADLQKKPGTAAACERSERLDTLSGLSQASQLTDSVMLAHIFERNTMTGSGTLALVYLKMKAGAEWNSPLLPSHVMGIFCGESSARCLLIMPVFIPAVFNNLMSW